MENSWITLYDVSSDGVGFLPWLFAVLRVAGICGGVLTLKKKRFGRFFLFLWLVFWVLAGGLGVGNTFYQHAANIHALRSGSCNVAEGPIENFHRQNLSKKGDWERFSVTGHEFGYSYANLGGGGLRSSMGFPVPLTDGLYVKIWYRERVICRLDARQKTIP